MYLKAAPHLIHNFRSYFNSTSLTLVKTWH